MVSIYNNQHIFYPHPSGTYDIKVLLGDSQIRDGVFEAKAWDAQKVFVDLEREIRFGQPSFFYSTLYNQFEAKMNDFE